MDAYKAGAQMAVNIRVKTAADQATPASAGRATGALMGGLGGTAGGMALGNLLAQHVGKMTRTKVLGMGVPFTGYGESLFGRPTGTMVGEGLGALAGGLTGAAAGAHGGELAGTLMDRNRRMGLAQNGQIDPRLLQYMLGQ